MANNPGVLPGLPTPHSLQNVPYTQADVTFAKANNALSPHARVAGVPAGGAAGAHLQGGGGGLGPAPAQLPALPPAAQLPNPYYPFDSKPALPWQHAPNTSNWPTLESIQSGPGRAAFLRTWGHPNVQGDPTEVSWYGVKYLGAGGFGSGGLWIQVDAHNNIIQARNGFVCP